MRRKQQTIQKPNTGYQRPDDSKEYDRKGSKTHHHIKSTIRLN